MPPKIRLNVAVRRYAFHIFKTCRTHLVQRVMAPYFDLHMLEWPKLQISLIAYRLHRLIDRPVERIEHYAYMPWHMAPPYEVYVARLPKEEAAKLHHQTIANALHFDTIAIYSDASQTPSGTGIGVAIAAYNLKGDFPELCHREKLNIGPGHVVYTGELEGLAVALEYASRTAHINTKFSMISDNHAAIA